MTVVKYNNRYGDAFTFTKTEDGNILWEGNFEWCICGWPNNYDEAYSRYTEDGGTLTLEEFKKEIHKAEYDSEGNYLGMSGYHKLYAHLIYSDKSIIDMVDPSGGPYLCENYGMEVFDKSFKGMFIQEFERTEIGYKIIIKK